MKFDHSIFEAAQRVMDMGDTPDDLLPLVIVSAVAHLGGLESDALRPRAWP